MPTFSSRPASLVLAGGIFLLFIGMGIFYNVTGQETEIKTQEIAQQEAAAQTMPTPPSVPLPTDEPTKPTPQQNVTQVPFALTASSTAELKTTTQAGIPIELTDTRNTASAPGCYDTCEYSYQCPDQLECQLVGTVMRCVDIRCPADSTCNCNKTQFAENTGREPITTARGGVQGVSDTQGVGAANLTATPTPSTTPFPSTSPVVSPSLVPVPTPTVRPVAVTNPTPRAQSTSTQLPEAGALDLTFAVLAIGTSLTGFGLLWRKTRS